MGMLYAKVSGQWVPVAPAGTVMPPAYAGARTIDAADQARFGNLAQPTNVGFVAEPAGGLLLISKAGQGIYFYDVTAPTTYRLYATFKPDYSVVNGWAMGTHPAIAGYRALWQDGRAGVADYTLLNKADGNTMLNASLGTKVYLCVGNTSKVEVADTSFQANGRVFAVYSPGTATVWDSANVIANASGGNNARISIYNSSISAYQFRLWPGYDGIGCLAWDGTSHSNLYAAAFTVTSSTLVKRSVRPLRSVPETVMPDLDPLSDTVETPDIMALRPVAFRPRVEPTRPVSDGNGGWVGEPFPEPQRTEGTRERLGLIAEEVQHVIPSAVSGHTEGATLGVDYAQITVALLDHVQRLTDEVTALRTRITELEGAS